MNPSQLIFSVFFVILQEICANSENDGMFTSSADLERLLSNEADLVKALKDYVQIEEDRIIKLKRHIQNYELISQKANSDVEKYIGNPLNSFLLIKRMTSDWKEMKSLMKPKTEEVFANLTDRYQR